MNKYVVHCKRTKHDVYVGRPSKWGNPFTVEEHGRLGAIKAYATWFWEQSQLVQEAKAELKGKVLGCWCAPQPCHADLLAWVANYYDPDEEEDDENDPLDVI